MPYRSRPCGSPLPGRPHTGRVRAQQVAGHRVRPGTGAAADVAELADAACAAEALRAPQRLQDRRVAIDRPQAVVLHRAAVERQEPRRVDVAGVVDEDEPAPRVDVDRRPRHPRGDDLMAEHLDGAGDQPVVQRPGGGQRQVTGPGGGTLDDHPAVLRGLGGLDRHQGRDVREPVQDILDLRGVQRPEVLPAAGRDQEEHAPQADAHLQHVTEQLRQFVDVALGDSGVHLEPQALVADHGGGPPGGGVRPLEAAEGVVGLRPGPVQGQRDGLRPRGVQLGQPFGGELRRHRRRQRHRQPGRRPVRDQLGQVRPLERVATGQHDQRAWRVPSGDVVQQRLALVGGELTRIGPGLGIGPAVPTHQLAGPGHLPDHDERLVPDVLVLVPYDPPGRGARAATGAGAGSATGTAAGAGSAAGTAAGAGSATGTAAGAGSATGTAAGAGSATANTGAAADAGERHEGLRSALIMHGVYVSNASCHMPRPTSSGSEGGLGWPSGRLG
ncbi:hypothetical protein SDC9_76574 [bioreactor metagenome]|uniref:Uncharacterized protein n=1 Tax=bioreactor metagenome TaxID=1076179 RepID=A0A644YN19_9ZZZZ